MRWLLLLISLPLYAQNFETNLLNLRGATEVEEILIRESLELIKEVVSSDEFRSRVKNMTYKIKNKTYKGFSQTDLSPEEILDSIYEAHENFKGGTDGVMDVNLEMYTEASSTIGYTYPKDPFVYMNRFHHDEFTVVETADNIFHEWLHKIKHDHEGTWRNKFRIHSVPYKLGDLVSEMIAERISVGDPVLKSVLTDMGEVVCHHSDLQDR